MAEELGWRDVDRLYRHLPEYESLWLRLPAGFDGMPRAPGRADDLPDVVTLYLTLVAALAELPRTQRDAYKAVVVGLVRVEDRAGRWVDVRRAPMTYAEAADYMETNATAVGQAVRRARTNLVKMLGGDLSELAA